MFQRDQKWFYRARKSTEEKEEAELVIDLEKLDSEEEDTVEPTTTEENIEPNTGGWEILKKKVWTNFSYPL